MPLHWLPDLATVTAVAACNVHSLALLDNGQVWAWGSNHYGQLGEGTTQDRHTPAPVQLTDCLATAIAAGGAHSLAR